MFQHFLKRMAPIVAVAMSMGVAGCGDIDIKINGKEGVPLAELDMTGDAPTELLVAGPDKVIVTEGDTLDITVEGDDSAVEKVRFVKDGKMLGVTREDSSWSSDDQAIVRVTMPAPEEIDVAGSGSVETATLASNAQVNIGGSGSVAIEQVAAESLEINIGGSGSVKAAGTTERLEIGIGGSGGTNLADLKADDAEISIAGSGSVSLASDGKVEASIMGSGSVNVTGSAECSVTAMGSGSLNCRPARTEDAEATES